MLVLDAFSGDAPPTHLLTREAFQVYLRHLAPTGSLLVNISNRHLDLKPVLGRLALDAGLTCRVQYDWDLTEDEERQGKSISEWAVMARDPKSLEHLVDDPRWEPIAEDPRAPLWTDDFSNILSVLDW